MQQGRQFGARLEQLFADDLDLIACPPELNLGQIGVEFGIFPGGKTLAGNGAIFRNQLDQTRFHFGPRLQAHHADEFLLDVSAQLTARFLDGFAQRRQFLLRRRSAITLLAGNLVRSQGRAESFYKKATRWDSSPRPAPAETKHKSGQRVRHAMFGEGIVIETKVSGGEEEVIVAFDDVGLKRLAASVANLEILKG